MVRFTPMNDNATTTIGANMANLAEKHVFMIPPRAEGCNIGMWMGFKHLMYIGEEAVLKWFRAQGAGPRTLWEEHGVEIEIEASSIRILRALHVDDVARVDIRRSPGSVDNGMNFELVAWSVCDGSESYKSFSARIRTRLRTQTDFQGRILGEDPRRGERIADGLVPTIVLDQDESPLRVASLSHDGAFTCGFRIPYHHCYYSNRLRMSGHQRLLEDIVDRFLDARGISIRTMLETRGWIPFVSTANIEILQDALMEEDLVLVYSVAGIFKNLTYDASYVAYATRRNVLVPVARGSITHGYAGISSRKDWGIVSFDENTVTALESRVPTWA